MSRIADRFGRAAATYEAATPIQRQVADLLADLVAAEGLPPGARVAEFGCGPGYLARTLQPRLDPALWIATDLALPMALAARQTTPLVAVMDGARPALKPGFDLVCSSLALQWIDCPGEALALWRSLVRPSGRLAVATMIEGSFREWRSALALAGAPPPGPAFASIGEARGWFGEQATIRTVSLTDRHASALAFLKTLRAAGIDASMDRALGPGVMRRAMEAFEEGGSAVTYEVVLAIEPCG